ncbi:J domain-containing protein [Parafrankia sp. BMG5.11]|uniref:J domain-containing protein n=1 Tax=Parafrankia sp. BMG5.11 TaxID=222540 RepID=UPI001A9FA77B|nr:DnaJ domain-containing protein [Parafrankia sp. BMG5.11]
MNDGTFIDYYHILQVTPDCDARDLERAYRDLAKQFHPDHAETADVEKLNEVISAYRALRDHDRRAEYDFLHATKTASGARYRYEHNRGAQQDQEAPLEDRQAHETILRHLYKRRRERANDPGVAPLSLQEPLNCTEELFAFHLWYLKAKGFVETTEQGTMAITIQGIDHVIATSGETMAEKLRITRSEPGPV